MKLILLLLAIYSLIFYQSYKIEKLKNTFLNKKESLDTKKFYRNNDDDRGYQNAALFTKDKYPGFSYPAKKQPIMRRVVFYWKWSPVLSE